jgi:hypothetical protein
VAVKVVLDGSPLRWDGKGGEKGSAGGQERPALKNPLGHALATNTFGLCKRIQIRNISWTITMFPSTCPRFGVMASNLLMGFDS